MNTKKLLSLLMIISVLCVSLVLPTAAANTPSYPVVVVTGYSSCDLYLDKGGENEKCIWKPEIKDIALNAIKERPLTFVVDTIAALLGITQPLTCFIKPYVDDLLEPMSVNPDGSSKYNVTVYPHAVGETTFKVMSKNHTVPDWNSMKNLSDKAGAENVYCCTLDWRMGQLDSAAVLNDYINAVLERTGKEKVNLCGISFGGQVVSTYLYYYGAQGKVNNAVMTVPAIGGTRLASRILAKEDMDISIASLLGFVAASTPEVKPLQPASQLLKLRSINKLLPDLVNECAYEKMYLYGSLWDFVPLDEYEALKTKLLDPTANAELIKKSDKLHYEVLANLNTTFKNLTEQGMSISIVAGCDSRLVLGGNANSDGVIDVNSATGATCESFPKRNLIGRVKTAVNSKPLKIDPSTCYLPSNTWFVSGMMHDSGFEREDISELLTTLVLSDEITDVNSNEKFPQFIGR